MPENKSGLSRNNTSNVSLNNKSVFFNKSENGNKSDLIIFRLKRRLDIREIIINAKKIDRKSKNSQKIWWSSQKDIVKLNYIFM